MIFVIVYVCVIVIGFKGFLIWGVLGSGKFFLVEDLLLSVV